MVSFNDITLETISKFWAKVDKSGGPDVCWPWLGELSKKGYGSFRGQRSHRIVWFLTNGVIPEGKLICHSCDVRYPPGDITYRKCCNPSHLWLGSNNENMQDMVDKRRSPSGERNGGAKLTVGQVLEIRRRYIPGKVRMEDLALEFGVSGCAISWILSRRRWRIEPEG